MRRIGLFTPLIVLLLLVSLPTVAKPAKETVTTQGSEITLNLKDADIRDVARLVSSITGKNFIVDPRANGHVTVISAKPIPADALFSVFLSVLEVHGLTAQPAGHNTWKIVPAIEGRQMPGYSGKNISTAPGAAMVTQVVQLQNVQVAQLVAALRPLMPSTAQLAAYAAANMLIISGRAANVERIIGIVHRLDKPLTSQFELIKLQYASASDIAQVLSSMLKGNSGQGQIPLQIAADPRSNSILVTGSPAERLQVKALVAQLDQPMGNTGNTHVLYLHYADAASLAKILQGYVKFTKKQKSVGKTAGIAPPTVAVSADTALNALIITGPPKTTNQLNQLIERLDVRQSQVLVQGIIAELSSDESAQLGISWAVASSGAAGVTNFPNGIAQVGQLAEGGLAGGGATTGATSLGNLASALPGGLLLGVGRIVKNGTSFVALLNALSSNSSANILSTPSLVTLNNKTATLVSGQKVPFVNGQYTNTTGANQGGAGYINPFQTVNRQQLGITLKIKPQINYGGDTVTLKINAKDNTLGTTEPGTVQPSTNNREIKTTIIAKDKQILVLGGLISDQLQESQQKVPLLGDIPLIGDLFRYRSSEKKRQNLMIFLRPTILHNAGDTSAITAPRYNQIREIQLARGTKVPLLPGVKPPVLPILSPASATGSAQMEKGAIVQPAPINATIVSPAAASNGHHGNGS
ncbi:MAG: type II secretion system secretin GspD [Gammaproteobacteria bacterium]